VGMIYRDVKSPESSDSSKSPESSDSHNLYILEIAEYDSLHSGVLKIPYEKWLKLNKHHDIYIRKLDDEAYKNKEIQSNILNEFSKLQKYKQQKLTDILELRRMMFFESYDEKKIQKLEKITCIEFIVMMLQNLELMEKDAMPASFYPCDLASNTFLKTYNIMKKMI
jgi:hypothetical protein